MADEHLGLILTANANAWSSAFTQMKANSADAGRAIDKVINKFNEAEKAAKKAGDVKFGDLVNNLNAAYDLTAKLVGKAVDLAHFSAEMKNLEARVPVERLRMMQEATEGAVKKTDLMKFSMRAMSGELRLTETGLEKVLKAANTLGDKGFGDTAENADKLLEALHKGSSKGLREFGFTLKDTSDKQANVNALMKEFARLAEQSPPVDEGLKEIERVQTAWSDFVDDVKAGLGSIILQLAEGIAKLTGLMDYSKTDKLQQRARLRANEKTPGLSMQDQGQLSFLPNGEAWAAAQIGGQYQQDRADKILAGTVAYAQSLASEVFIQAMTDTAMSLGGGIKAGMKGAKLKSKDVLGKLPGGAGGKDRRTWWGEQLVANMNRDTSFVRPDLEKLGRGGLGTLEFIGGQPDRQPVDIGAWESHYTKELADEDKLKRVEEFNQKITDSTTLVGAGYKVMTSAAQAAIEAAISGSESLASAARKASAAALKSIALEAAAKAVFSVAEAIYTRDPSKLVAAAEYGAAATLAAAGAAALGGGGGGSAGTGTRASPRSMPGGGFGGGTGGGGGSSGAQNINIYIGDGFVGRPDELAVAIADKLSHGVQSGAVRNLAQTKPGAVTFR